MPTSRRSSPATRAFAAWLAGAEPRVRDSLRSFARVVDVEAVPAWHDLGPEGREQAFERARAIRALEAALDPDGLSTTARAVLARITGAR